MARRQLLAYVGWLVTNPIYLEERDQLRELSNSCRLPVVFPVRAPVNLPASYPGEGRPLPDQDRLFGQRVEAFLTRWCLMELVTWDLPFPQGPLLGLVGTGRVLETVLGKGAVLFVPWHFRVHAKAEVLEELYKAQRQTGRESPTRFMEQDRWPVEHIETYAKLFLVRHFRSAVASRYSLTSHRDRVGQINRALAQWLIGTNSQEAEHEDQLESATRWVRKLLWMARERMNGRLPTELKPRH